MIPAMRYKTEAMYDHDDGGFGRNGRGHGASRRETRADGKIALVIKSQICDSLAVTITVAQQPQYDRIT